MLQRLIVDSHRALLRNPGLADQVSLGRARQMLTDAFKIIREHKAPIVDGGPPAKYMPFLWIDDSHSSSHELVLAIVTTLIGCPFPVIFTCSEDDGFRKLSDGMCVWPRCSVVFSASLSLSASCLLAQSRE